MRVTLKEDAVKSLAEFFPDLAPSQAIRRLLALPATERKARRKKSRKWWSILRIRR